MVDVLIDTHVAAWMLRDPHRLSRRGLEALSDAETVHISAASFYEIGLKASRGRWPEMAPVLDILAGQLVGDGVRPRPLDPDTMLLAGRLDWPHRDPFDRMIAAAALGLGCPIVSADRAFDTLPSVARLW